jgi:hypothetical protein
VLLEVLRVLSTPDDGIDRAQTVRLPLVDDVYILYHVLRVERSTRSTPSTPEFLLVSVKYVPLGEDQAMNEETYSLIKQEVVLRTVIII